VNRIKAIGPLGENPKETITGVLPIGAPAYESLPD
jgi:hypothetical protein